MRSLMWARPVTVIFASPLFNDGATNSLPYLGLRKDPVFGELNVREGNPSLNERYKYLCCKMLDGEKF